MAKDEALGVLPEWNLADLYVGRNDPRIETDLAAAEALLKEFFKSRR